jgi:uncharacterized membrane protein
MKMILCKLLSSQHDPGKEIKMAHIEQSIHINRPVAEVFAFFADVSNDKKWRDGLVETRIDGALRVGAKVTEMTSLLGQKVEMVAEITAYDPPRRYAMRSVGGKVKLEADFKFEDMSGGTHITVNVNLEAGDMDEATVASDAKKQFDADLARLKSVLEK